MSVPNCSLHSVQRIIFAAEAAALVHVRRAHESPVQPIGPAVVATLYAAGKLSFRSSDEPRAPVPADVVKRAHIVLGIAGDDDALAGHFAQEIISGMGDLFCAPGAYPRLTVEPLHFIPEDFRIGVIPRG